MATIFLTGGQRVHIDEQDYELISQYSWNKSTKGYATATVANPSKGKNKWGRTYRDTLFMHRLICLSESQVDHINGDRLDNRRCNLRPCTNTQNQYNRKIQKNKSGLKGVHQRKLRWVAVIRYQKILMHLGSFQTPSEAALAYDQAALKYFGEFANINGVTT